MLDQAKRDLERHRGLVSQGATTRQEFETMESRTKVAGATLIEGENMIGYARVAAPFSGVITRKLAEVTCRRITTDLNRKFPLWHMNKS